MIYKKRKPTHDIKGSIFVSTHNHFTDAAFFVQCESVLGQRQESDIHGG